MNAATICYDSNLGPGLRLGGMKEFAPFRLDTVNQCLWRRRDDQEDERLLVAPKAFSLLRYLVEHAGHLVTHCELLNALWFDAEISVEVLKHHIFALRNILGDNPNKPLFIETLPRRGYQFIAEVNDTAPADLDGPVQPLRRGIVELRDCLCRALNGERQIVFLAGEPGLTANTLVQEFERQAARDFPGIRIARGRCEEGYGNEAYYPMLEAVGDLCHGPGGDSVIHTLAAHAPTWLAHIPALAERGHRELLEQTTVDTNRQRMLREIVDALNTMASGRPVLLILEDLQWADPSTVDLISALARSRTPAKLMLVGTYRHLEASRSGNLLKSLKPDLLIHRLCLEIGMERKETVPNPSETRCTVQPIFNAARKGGDPHAEGLRKAA